jgi:hypothetical protein
VLTVGFLSGKKRNAEPQTGQFEVWGQRGSYNVDVVGESFHQRQIRGLLPKRLGADSVEVLVPVGLVHNPRNRHDSNAVEVQAATGLVGHLSHEDAARYAPVLAGFRRDGLTAMTTARVWGRDRKHQGTGRKELFASVRLDLREPHMLIPANKPPAGLYQILPLGSAIRVTGEEGHMAAISPYLNVAGECWVHATVHETTDAAARSSKALAEVRIDGNTVGRLTPKLSGDMLPAVQFLAGRGEITCVHAIVKGNSLKAEVVLYALRAHELPAGWFTGLGTPVLAPEGLERESVIQDAALLRPADDETLPAPLARAPPTHLRVHSEGESAPGDALLRDDHGSDAIRPTSMTARRATFGRP